MAKILIALLLFSINVQAKIYELNSYSDLDRESLKGALVVFDIDNTLLRQDHMIGTHQWGDDLKERMIHRGWSSADASAYQHQKFGELQPHVRVVPVEPIESNLLKYLEAQNIPHFALTARASQIAQTTLNQLTVLQHNFARSFPQQKDNEALGSHLKDGIVFSGDVPKGELLKKIIENSVDRPTKVIFIDDRKYNLDSVEQALADSGIDLISYRYGGADQYVKSYDRDVADLEFSFFLESGDVIPDQQALAMRNDFDKIVRQRFKNYLAKTQPYITYVSPEPCKAFEPEKSYTCIFYDDERDWQVNFEFDRDPQYGTIIFGRW